MLYSVCCIVFSHGNRASIHHLHCMILVSFTSHGSRNSDLEDGVHVDLHVPRARMSGQIQ